LYCDDDKTFSELVRNLESIDDEPNPMILIDFHGKGLGSKDGNLSLLQIGLPSKTYVVDAITLTAEIPRLRPFLQDRNIRKIVWDGRLGYSELWHRYGIRLENVLDLQLVYLHEKYDVTLRNSIPLSGRMAAIKEKKLLSAVVVESELKSTLGYELTNFRTSTFESREVE
jgi:3'-5' exonuclease